MEKKINSDKKGNKTLIAAIILGISLVAAVYIYALSTRYEFHPSSYLVLDKWTGEVIKPRR